jgi:NAD(P)-dependent dehydrogenase (short-subunit alcohol dehydrogenase family)
MSLANVLITGANRGIGLEFVKQFVALTQPPKHVFATCRDPTKAEELNKVAAANVNVHVLKLEVKDYASYGNLVQQVSDVIGDSGLDVLVNNAGVYHKVDIENGGPELLVDNFEVNAVTPLMITRAFLPLLRQSASAKRRTVVANITSKMGSMDDNTSGNHYAYRASKAALNMITKSLSVDLSKDGILAYAIHPGWVQTDMGGKNALINTETSVLGMLGSITAGDAALSGKMLNYDGKVIPW